MTLSFSSLYACYFIVNIITSADEVGEVMFSVEFVCLCVCLCVCWFVRPDDNSKSIIAITMELSGNPIAMPE